MYYLSPILLLFLDVIQALSVVFDPKSAQYNADLNGDDDDDEMDEEDNDDNSVDNLMELDIISFDEEDMDFLESEDESDSRQITKSGRFEIDPCCFNFDWNGNNSSNQINKTPLFNLCGLETWGMNSNQSKLIPNATMQIGSGELQQKHGSLLTHPQHSSMNNSMILNNNMNINVTSFLCSR